MIYHKEYFKDLSGREVFFLNETHILFSKDHYQENACSFQGTKTDGLFFLLLFRQHK